MGPFRINCLSAPMSNPLELKEVLFFALRQYILRTYDFCVWAAFSYITSEVSVFWHYTTLLSPQWITLVRIELKFLIIIRWIAGWAGKVILLSIFKVIKTIKFLNGIIFYFLLQSSRLVLIFFLISTPISQFNFKFNISSKQFGNDKYSRRIFVLLSPLVTVSFFTPQR